MLGDARRYTRIEVEARSGVARERNERLWRALGFADVDDDDVVFTDADVEALKLIDGLVGSGIIDPTLEAAAARAAGQSLARLAEWEIGLLNDYVVAQLDERTDDADEADRAAVRGDDPADDGAAALVRLAPAHRRPGRSGARRVARRAGQQRRSWSASPTSSATPG